LRPATTDGFLLLAQFDHRKKEEFDFTNPDFYGALENLQK